MDSITIISDHDHLELDVDRISRLLALAAREEGTSVHELSIILTDHPTVLEMNRTYLDHDFHTDVLAFDLRDENDEAIVGEVYVDLDTAAERCSEFGNSFETEAARYALHGLLHLLGYRDKGAEDAANMRRRENVLLERFWTAV